MTTPFVSVLIDTYNHERFIEEAIQSVLSQDFPASEREILVVDDGSTDRTAEILRKFASQIRILRKPNGGQASAFNLGIPQCRGEIVAFLDGMTGGLQRSCPRLWRRLHFIQPLASSVIALPRFYRGAPNGVNWSAKRPSFVSIQRLPLTSFA